MYKCEICGKEFNSKHALGPHKRLTHDPNYVKPANGRAGKPSWNKGLTAETSAIVKAQKDVQIENLKSGVVTHSGVGKQRSEATKRKLALLWTPEKRQHSSNAMIARLDSLANGHYCGTSGSRFRHGWYKDVYCDSSWELAFILFCNDHGTDITRCTERRHYVFKEKHHHYYPDFVVNGKTVEIKGWVSDKWKAKLAANPDIVVLYAKEMRPILKYVKNMYGNDFTRLYDSQPCD
jgi:hypothetical protein